MRVRRESITVFGVTLFVAVFMGGARSSCFGDEPAEETPSDKKTSVDSNQKLFTQSVQIRAGDRVRLPDASHGLASTWTTAPTMAASVSGLRIETSGEPAGIVLVWLLAERHAPRGTSTIELDVGNDARIRVEVIVRDGFGFDADVTPGIWDASRRTWHVSDDASFHLRTSTWGVPESTTPEFEWRVRDVVTGFSRPYLADVASRGEPIALVEPSKWVFQIIAYAGAEKAGRNVFVTNAPRMRIESGGQVVTAIPAGLGTSFTVGGESFSERCFIDEAVGVSYEESASILFDPSEEMELIAAGKWRGIMAEELLGVPGVVDEMNPLGNKQGMTTGPLIVGADAPFASKAGLFRVVIADAEKSGWTSVVFVRGRW